MEVDFTPEQEAQLSQLASRRGSDTRHLVKDAALRLLEEDRQFCEGVERGFAAAQRGEFVESSEVWAKVENILRS